MEIKLATLNPADQIEGLRRAGAGSHPMRRDDWRQPIRAANLRDARAYLLTRAGAPWHVIESLQHQKITEWNPTARATIREEMNKEHTQ